MKAFGALIVVSLFCLVVFITQATMTDSEPVAFTKVDLAIKKKRLKSFSTEAELATYLNRRLKRRTAGGGGGGGKEETKSLTLSSADAIAGDIPNESVTNTQHAGVDEGGIVKLRGDHLVVLRRGRLFTISIGDNSLNPVSVLNAFGPDIDPTDTWYDEMLISDDNIVVVGYSYDRGGTELGLFKISDDGQLKYRSTYHLRANDYYSSRNYASRLIGNKLIFYSPLYLDPEAKNVLDSLPGMRKWHKGAKESEFRRIITPQHVYRSEQALDPDGELALHTVTTCDLSGPDMTCDAASVIGPEGDVFYVSPKSVYVWASNWDWDNEKEHNRSVLYQMPLDGSAPGALRVSGSPVDQFSFLEDEQSDLNVLVRSESKGDGMWGAEVAEGETALLRVSPDLFSDGSSVAPASNYRRLPDVPGYTFQNRFVGDYLLYGTGSGWGRAEKVDQSKLYAVNWKTGALTTLVLPHSVDRLDALAADGIVVGTNGKDLLFTSVQLDGIPKTVDTFTVEGASQGETRSQGFFYKPETQESGMLGLPITVSRRPGYRQLFEGSASVIFLKNSSLRFSDLGQLASRSISQENDNCKASCVDWYGNARPIFARGRIFALLGYEIVEGTLSTDHIEELRRVDFTPRVEKAEGR